MDSNAKYKIPGRQVWCCSIWRWMSAMLWIYVVSALFRYHLDYGTNDNPMSREDLDAQPRDGAAESGRSTVRAKFKVQRIELTAGTKRGPDVDDKPFYMPTVLRTIVLSPVYGNGDPKHENTKFWEATPTGEIRLGTINETAADLFEMGAEYYIDFTKA